MRGRAVFGRGSGGTTPAGAGDGGRGAAAAGTAGTAGTAGGARPHTCQLTGSSERETGIKYRHRRFQAGARWEYQPKGRAQGLPGETARARRGDGCASAEPRPHGPDARPPGASRAASRRPEAAFPSSPHFPRTSSLPVTAPRRRCSRRPSPPSGGAGPRLTSARAAPYRRRGSGNLAGGGGTSRDWLGPRPRSAAGSGSQVAAGPWWSGPGSLGSGGARAEVGVRASAASRAAGGAPRVRAGPGPAASGPQLAWRPVRRGRARLPQPGPGVSEGRVASPPVLGGHGQGRSPAARAPCGLTGGGERVPSTDPKGGPSSSAGERTPSRVAAHA